MHLFANLMPGEYDRILPDNQAETALIRICALCNRAEFKPNQVF